MENSAFNKALTAHIVATLGLRGSSIHQSYHTEDGTYVEICEQTVASYSSAVKRGVQVTVDSGLSGKRRAQYDFFFNDAESVEDPRVAAVLSRVRARVDLVSKASAEYRAQADAKAAQHLADQEVRQEVEARLEAAGYPARVTIVNGKVGSIDFKDPQAVLKALSV